MTTTLTYAAPITLNARRPKFNTRLLLFVFVISTPFLYVVGSTVHDSMTGGITDYGDYVTADLKLLGSFQFNDKDGQIRDVPSKYRALDGKKVVLSGKMYAPTTAGNKGVEFQFVYDVNKCCVGGPPLVQERVFAHAKKEVNIYRQNVLAEIVGTLHVRLIRSEGKVVSVFDMDVDSAKAVGG